MGAKLSIDYRNKVALHNYRLVWWVINHKFSRFNFEHGAWNGQDLFQEGFLGLLKAIDRYDYFKYKCKLSTYANAWIYQQIARFIMNSGAIKIPVYIKEQYISIMKRYPEIKGLSELYDKGYITKKKYDSLKMCELKFLSKDAPIVADDGRVTLLEEILLVDYNDEKEFHDIRDDIDRSFILLCVKQAAEEIKNERGNCKSEKRNIEILLRRLGFFNDDMDTETLESIGGRFGITRERIRQIEQTGIKKLKYILMNKYNLGYGDKNVGCKRCKENNKS